MRMTGDPRNRVVFFRLTQDEYSKLKEVSTRNGARNLSDFNAGSATVSNGSATSAAAEAVHTMGRAPAERLRRSHAISHAAPSTSVLLSAALARIGHADAVQFNILSSLFLGLLDHCRHAVQFLPRQPRGGDVQKRRHNLFRAPVEKCLQIGRAAGR